MAYAYGDMATNIIQPFWAIPLLGVARLDFRDILGYEILVFALYTRVHERGAAAGLRRAQKPPVGLCAVLHMNGVLARSE